jgi:hypothetical protein
LPQEERNNIFKENIILIDNKKIELEDQKNQNRNNIVEKK